MATFEFEGAPLWAKMTILIVSQTVIYSSIFVILGRTLLEGVIIGMAVGVILSGVLYYRWKED